MIALDTNLLVYAHRADSPFHDRARGCIEALISGNEAWALPWPCVHEFFAIVTHRRLFVDPTPPAAAIDQVDAWLESPRVALLTESTRHWPVLKDLLTAGAVSGPLVHDARVAALCLQHGVRELWTADRDFSRFSKLRRRNPLVDG